MKVAECIMAVINIMLFFICSLSFGISSAQILTESQSIPGGELIVSSLANDKDSRLFGHKVYDRGINNKGPSGSWIDLSTNLRPGRLDEFYIFISGNSPPQPQKRSLWLQIWRPVSSYPQYTLVWQQEVEVQSGTNTGMLYKFKVGNRLGGSNFETKFSDKIGWSYNGAPGLVSNTINVQLPDVGHMNAYTGAHPSINESYTFNTSQAEFSVAVKIYEAAPINTALTLSDTGCSCVGDPDSRSCACCQIQIISQKTCTCPSVTWPSRCNMCSEIDNCPSDYTCDIMLPEGCYQKETNTTTFDQAFKFCTQQPNAYFGNINTMNLSQQVSQVSKQYNSTLVWTGAYVKDYLWQWILTDQTKPLEVQGCFLNSGSANTVLDNTYNNLPNVNSLTCNNHCDSMNFEYAGLRVGANGDLMCSCGMHFPSEYPELPLTQCACASNNSNLCGGVDKEAIFYTGGSMYTNFVDSQTNPTDHCVVLNTATNGWERRNCLENNNIGVICEYPGVQSKDCKSGDHVYISNRCVSLHPLNVTWYEAGSKCGYNGNGHLVKLDRETVDMNFRVTLKTTQPSLWWIGLTNRAFVWSDRTSTPVSLHQWAPNEPSPNHDCVAMDVTANNTWYSMDCMNHVADYYCQRDYDNCQSKPCKNGGTCNDQLFDFDCDCPPQWKGKTCNTPITTPAGPTSTLSVSTPVVLVNDGGNKDGGLSTVAIIGLAIAGVVLVVIVVAVVGMLLYRSSKMEKELQELKLSTIDQANGINNTDGSFHFTRQDTVYESIDDNYQRFERENNDSHYYKTMQTEENHPGYQGLDGVVSNGSATYQQLNPDDPKYQGLVNGIRQENSGPGPYAELQHITDPKAPDPPPRTDNGVLNNIVNSDEPVPGSPNLYVDLHGSTGTTNYAYTNDQE